MEPDLLSLSGKSQTYDSPGRIPREENEFLGLIRASALCSAKTAKHESLLAATQCNGPVRRVEQRRNAVRHRKTRATKPVVRQDTRSRG